MRTLISAIGVFTVLPVRSGILDRTIAARIIRVFPLVGTMLGVLAGACAAAVGWLSGNLALAAVLGVVVLAACTGALHLDGLADTADGLGSRKPAKQALEIMRRSDVGPMGVAALVLVLLIDVAALAGLALPTMLAALIAGPLIARAACTIATGQWLPGARESGFGALFTQVTTRQAAAVVGVLSLAAVSLIGFVPTLVWRLPGTRFVSLLGELGLGAGLAAALAFAVAGLVAFSVGRVAARWFSRRLGGLTGDTFGALIELTAASFWLSVGLLL